MHDACRLSHLFGCNNEVFRTFILAILYGQFVLYIAHFQWKNTNRPRRTKSVGLLGAMPPDAKGLEGHFRVRGPTETDARGRFW
jgi:hypothetical protein